MHTIYFDVDLKSRGEEIEAASIALRSLIA